MTAVWRGALLPGEDGRGGLPRRIPLINLEVLFQLRRAGCPASLGERGVDV